MPGLVKIGKTTNTPSQRMSELQSTGVPTPFELEFSITVNDCHKAERLAHTFLGRYRVSSNREFFRTTPKIAIEKILEVIDECQVVDFRESHGLEKIEAVIQQRKKALKDKEHRKQLEIDRKRSEQEAEIRTKRDLLSRKLYELRLQLVGLGPRPPRKEVGMWVALGFCYIPAPIGWIFWLGMLSIFDPKRSTAGFFSMALVIAGYLAYKASSKIDQNNEILLKPFHEIDHQIEITENELKKLEFGQSVNDDDDPEIIQRLKAKIGNF